MNTVELLQYALGNAFGILEQVVVDLDQDLADWQPPGIANPIGATYWHAISSADFIAHDWAMGQPPLSQKDGWAQKLFITPPPAGEEDFMTQMRVIRVDLEALHAYAQAVAGAIQGWLAALKPEDLQRTKETPLGELNLAQLLEVFVIWHINAHCGEISALKGCQGVKGYPF